MRLDVILQTTRINNVQELVFRQCWEGRTYSEIAEQSGYDVDYIKEVGYKLWKLLSKKLGEKVTKSNIQVVLRRHFQQTQAVSEECLPAFGLQETYIGEPTATTDSFKSTLCVEGVDGEVTCPHQDWGEVSDIPVFYGRTIELATLKQWIVAEQCRLVALLGAGGIGKTALSVKLAEEIRDQFEYLIWRSLKNAPSIRDILADLLQFLSDQQETDVQADAEDGISRLLNYLRQHRCLLIFDNAETILCSGERVGCYLEGYEAYGELFRRVGESRHQSCLILTSREKPRELAPLEGKTVPVRSLQLKGLQEADIRELFSAKGTFYGSDSEWKVLIEHYAGNPLALKMVAAGIQDLLSSNISEFLELLKQRAISFKDIRDLLDQQFNRLSDLEKEVMYWLAIEREPISFSKLRDNILSATSRRNLSDTLRSLVQRSLIEKKGNRFTQQPLVMEYMTDQLIEQVYQAIATQEIDRLNCHSFQESSYKTSFEEMYRDLEAIMWKRGIKVDHSTIRSWVQCYAPELEKRCHSLMCKRQDSTRQAVQFAET